MQRTTFFRPFRRTLPVVIFHFLLCIFVTGGLAADGRLQPADLAYLGAFRLPEGSGNSDWTYSGNALAYYPEGDRAGPDDGFPGSLFGTGNDTQLFVSEIDIPVPKISTARRLEDLNSSRTLQPFTNVFVKMVPYLEQPRVGMTCLPDLTGEGGGRIYFAIGMHLQDTGFDPSHGWFSTDLSRSQPAGLWVFNGYTGYVTNDYLCRIPKAWADKYTHGQYLASGRAREGPWAGGGPALFAWAPWKDGNPPAPGVRLQHITPLLLYGHQPPGIPEISSRPGQRLPDNADADRYRGCEWLDAGHRSAVIFIGTKAVGASWYGFANGVRWDYGCGQNCPDVPEWPYDNRGFWADDFRPQILFYDPRDLGAVADGRLETWAPEPYAVMDLSPFFFEPDYTREDLVNYKRDFVGAMSYDPQRQLLYVMEPLVEEDGRSLVHVFAVQS